MPRKTSLVQCSKNNHSHLNLTYLNNDEHTHLDKRTGNTDILAIAFISPNLTKHEIQFLTGDDLGSDHLPIEISIDAQPHRNIPTNPIRYKFDQTDREVFESTREAALSSSEVRELKSAQDIDKYTDFTDFIVTTFRMNVLQSISSSYVQNMMENIILTSYSGKSYLVAS